MEDIINKLEKIVSDMNGDLRVEMQYSGNDGYFKYWVSKWNHRTHNYEDERMFDNLHDLNQYIQEVNQQCANV